MRISQLSLAGRGAWPDLHIDQLRPHVNVFFGRPGSGKSSIAQLVNHLLYGKAQSLWRQQFGQTVPLTEGRLVVESQLGNLVLRRHIDPDRSSRLTVASAAGGAVDSRTVQNLLADLSPQVAAQLAAVDFAEAPSVEWLLDRGFTLELAKARTRQGRLCVGPHCPQDGRLAESAVDRRRVDELIRQRDNIAAGIEKQLAVRRVEADVLVGELEHIERKLEELRGEIALVQRDLQACAGEIAHCETRLRYLSLTSVARGIGSPHNEQAQRRELTELEAEINRCRRSLGDLQTREATIRGELAQLSPDGTADRAGCLADTRASVNALERLLDDLDAEVALLARAHDQGRCLGVDSHNKLTPVATLLRQQVYSLCGLVSEQERQLRRQQLTLESRQVARAQFDLGERLEQLLERRERLIHTLDRADKLTMPRAQGPVADHCQCTQHAHFLAEADPLLVGHGSRAGEEAELREHHRSHLHRQEDMEVNLASLQKKLAQLEQRWQEIQRQRAGMVGQQGLDQRRQELERLETLIHQALQPVEQQITPMRDTWRASDLLAKMSDGLYTQIRLGRDANTLTVLDRTGQTLRWHELPTAVHDQLYLALTLALVSAFARRGIHLPVVLDEPFLRQDAAGSAAMAGVLDEFARNGHQLLVFTEDLEALRRFQVLNSQVFDLATWRRQPAAIPQDSNVTQTRFTRVVRETADGQQTPVLQFRSLDSEIDAHRLLSETSPLAEFPVLGSGTTDVFAHLGIHTIGELLVVEPVDLTRRLERSDITADTVRLWQAHMTLMCSVPGLTLNDAQVLTACGIHSVEQLQMVVPMELESRIRDFLRTSRGQRFAALQHRYHASLIRDWAQNARSSTPRPGGPSRSSTSSSSQSNRSTRTGRVRRRPNRSEPDTRSTRSERLSREVRGRTSRFHLSRESSTEDAPGISPKTAEYLARLGIRTVADLLKANATATAVEVAVDSITPNLIADWQHQARLVCRIPELRGYGAQLLVACGLTTPEQIAATPPEELVRKVQSLCATNRGKRILRTMEAPSAAKIRAWAENATHCRPLEAA